MSTQKTADEKPRRGWWPFGGSASAQDEDEEPEHGITARKGRATPGRRAVVESESGGNIVTRTVGGVGEFIEGVQAEIKKVSWPTREETRRLSMIVLITTIIASLILGLIALFYSELFRLGLNQPMIFIGFFVVVVVIGFVFYRRSNRSSSSPY